MIPFGIDISDVIEEFSVLADQSDQLSSHVLERLVENFMFTWEGKVNSNLKQTRQEYKNAMMEPVFEDSRNAVVGLLPTESNLALMIEDGASSWDMKCIVNSKTNIYTSSGYKTIGKIKEGDLVLTHSGKFKRVVLIFKEKNDDKFIYKIKSNIRGASGRNSVTLNVTWNHPILTNNGWVIAKNLNPNKDKIIVSATKCINCGKLTPTRDLDYKRMCCSNKCRGEFSVKLDGGLNDWIKENVKGDSSWGFGGWDKELHELAINNSMKQFSKNRMTNPEMRLWKKIKQIEGIECQYKFIRNEVFKTKTGVVKNRLFFFDFAIPKHKICIEVNRERWHTKEQDDRRKKEVESHGWRYISFWSKEIYSNLNGCVKEINRVLKNHNGEYFVTETNFTIEKIDLTKLSKNCTTYNNKYNMTVEDDSSYIANGIITHNSGFATSEKKKIKKNGDGWYLTIPFRYATNEAVGESMIFSGKLPKEIQKIAKKVSPAAIAMQDLPEQYQKIGINKTSKYEHKNPIYEGLGKRNIASTQNEKRSGYMSFRKVSDNSDEGSWQHPGFEAHKFMDKTLDSIDIGAVVDDAVDEFLKQLG